MRDEALELVSKLEQIIYLMRSRAEVARAFRSSSVLEPNYALHSLYEYDPDFADASRFARVGLEW